MKRALTFLSTFALVVGVANAAYAASNLETCTAVSSNSYSCVAWSGYAGEDGYNVDQWSNVVNGTKHSCTSFAAYMLYHENTHFSQISHFNSAQYWDTDAAPLSGVIISHTPHVGDIAQWDADSLLAFGHVAVVLSVTTSGGAVVSIDTADDNATRGVTTEKTLYPTSNNNTASWPDHFITFPGFSGIYIPIPSGGGGGGKPPAPVTVTPSTN